MPTTPPDYDSPTVAAHLAQGGVVYFGQWWDAPAFDGATQVAIPAGRVCLHCTEAVTDADSGTFTPCMRAEGQARIEVVHIECWLRAGLGSLSHLEHRCSCYGGGDHEGYTRADARAVMNWVLTRRASAT